MIKLQNVFNEKPNNKKLKNAWKNVGPFDLIGLVRKYNLEVDESLEIVVDMEIRQGTYTGQVNYKDVPTISKNTLEPIL